MVICAAREIRASGDCVGPHEATNYSKTLTVLPPGTAELNVRGESAFVWRVQLSAFMEFVGVHSRNFLDLRLQSLIVQTRDLL